jgi:hypothetical protein
MEAYQGYFENGRIIPIGNPPIPNGSEVIITVLDVPAGLTRAERQKKALEEFWLATEDCGEELGPEFDEILSRRININRELDL